MIGRLRGLIIEKQPPKVLIEVGGVGYEVFMPMTCFYELPDNGKEVIVLTHFAVREDAQVLYGFNHEQERELFRELIKVNGVGPKLALAILSGMSAQQFISAVEQGEIKTLVKLPGVGTKTAERLIVEMKDRLKRFGEDLSTTSSIISSSDLKKTSNQIESEAVSALIALGYKPQEASRIISKVIKPEMDSETLIREALKSAL
ncbi:MULTISPECIES: Holliday junction branch migration protein RuvA [unclassified Gilliamella]|uniref:Holliday junction branch migration protein RuvA n=1 Tax=unclassified Gilliamella TaxID=2685620 RepID=UPI002269A9EA|nr:MULTISPECIES: Holliday junction branch migration protein RuvA [unclassified Gilliamella]MCX8642224.1 Holliday junction branch migration protein RuvA [Gilliamella sp. B3835]MCX8707622.1 Holliday junction branch migration protein RuvA [Gilliamella sp. B3783]MCX8710051.1 Holliday junction branch migration protein RuvA [Gilliamella sp. B3780]MCX8713519.1 Holliday junction branch migration protein RuvA [Gilliamella sp. B3781]MCX8716605.1 Holliday junction branch migration protein RuvA [Gilliamel